MIKLMPILIGRFLLDNNLNAEGSQWYVLTSDKNIIPWIIHFLEIDVSMGEK